jgi:hypothetical protein
MKNSISGFNITYVEKKYGATFIGDFPVKLKNGNWGQAGAVFYQPNPDVSKGHTNYFGLAITDTGAVIYNASYLLDTNFSGVKVGDEYIWSRHVHDYREVLGGFIDGGFDYFRHSVPLDTVMLKIEKDKIVEK